MMTEIFSVVESELSQLVAFGEELDPLNSLNMLVVIGQRVTQAQQVCCSVERIQGNVFVRFWVLRFELINARSQNLPRSVLW